jgi:6-phosphogluconolactonase
VSLRFEVRDDAAGVAEAAAALLSTTAEAGGQIALSGGSTVGAAYALAARADWSNAVVWWGDERCVPPDDERSNYLLAKRSLLDRLAAPPEVHRIRGELPSQAAAEAYDAELDGVAIDLAFNGIGPDGHTASLFPGSPQLEAGDRLAAWGPAGLPPFVDRVTMTLPLLNACRTVAFVVVGADKADAARRAFCVEPGPATPASLVRGTAETVAILDRAAASLLDI